MRDKGTWKLGDGLVVLTSDNDITWDPDAERKYVAVRRKSRPHEILLVGTGENLSYFAEHAKDDPETELLVCAKQLQRTFNRTTAGKTKTKLMRESWCPEYFHATPK